MRTKCWTDSGSTAARRKELLPVTPPWFFSKWQARELSICKGCAGTRIDIAESRWTGSTLRAMCTADLPTGESVTTIS